MQSLGPYQVVRALGTSQLGTVWWVTDEFGRGLTVATLDGTVAADPQWRDRFASIATSMAQPEGGGIPYQGADFTAPEPWVAYVPTAGLGAEHVFQRLGVEYRPVPAQPEAAPFGAPSSPAAGSSGWSFPTSAPPISGPPISGPPISGPPDPRQPSGPPDQGWHGGHDVFGLTSPVSPGERRIPLSPPRKRRTGLFAGIAAVAVVVLAAAGILVWQVLPGGDPGAAPTAGPSAATGGPTVQTTAPGAVALPASPPSQPGAEPPRNGVWPAQWPKFQPADNIRTLTGLAGLGFTVKVPQDWQCAPAAQAAGFTSYSCGMAPAGDVQAGGELIVRDCPPPCSGGRQGEMRRAEEAWGLRWAKTGPSAFLAESNSVQIDGEARYTMVLVAYYRSGAEGAIDKQLVLRMTAHPDKANTVRRVANYLRDTLVL